MDEEQLQPIARDENHIHILDTWAVHGWRGPLQLIKAKPVKELVAIVETSRVPLAEEEPLFTEISEKDARGEVLSEKEHLFLLSLVDKAKEWEKAVQNSSQTERDETLSG